MAAGATDFLHPCQTCNPSLSSTSWSVADDGTACTGGVCSASACVAASSTRTITLAFRTLYRPDDGSETEIHETPPGGGTPSAILVADASGAGYASAPVSAVAAGTYAASDVPVGKYWLRLDQPGFIPQSDGIGAPEIVASTLTELVPLVRSAPDLSTILGARADLARVSTSTPVTVSVSNLEPYTASSQLVAVSSQADAVKWPYFMVPRPTTGATSHTFTFDWNRTLFEQRPSGLPDPAKGDLVFWFQRTHEPVSSGDVTGFARRATRYARADTMLLQDGVPASVSVPLVPAPQTGSIATAARGDLFAALAPEVNPAAEPLVLTIAVTATPRSASYPDMPGAPLAPVFLLQSAAPSHVDFGTFTYWQFLEPRWDEFRVVSYAYRNTYAADLSVDAHVEAIEPASWPQALSAVPVLTPPREPRINGSDAFAAQFGVGTQPVLSWAAPATGAPTSYVVTISGFAGLQPEDVGELSATVYGGTSFQVPPGFLRSGAAYYARITARSAPWDVPARAPFRNGMPRYTADCLTAAFLP